MADFADTLGEEWLEGAEASNEPEEQAIEPVQEAPQEQVAESEAPVEQVTETERPQPGHIPIQALLDEREKRQRYERELEELRKQNAPKPQAPAPMPDLYDDPVAYDQAMQARVAEAQWNARCETSELLSRQVHGDEAVTAAEQWVAQKVAQNPSFAMEIRQQKSPYDWAVRQHKREQTLNAFGDKSPEDFAREYAISQGWLAQTAPEQGAQPQPTSGRPAAPRSLANQPSAGGAKSVDADAIWGEGMKFNLDR